MDWGSVPVWVSAVAGVVALVAAVLAARFTWLALIRERQRDAERRERERREQASKVTAWLVTIIDDQFSFRGQDFDGSELGCPAFEQLGGSGLRDGRAR